MKHTLAGLQVITTGSSPGRDVASLFGPAAALKAALRRPLAQTHPASESAYLNVATGIGSIYLAVRRCHQAQSLAA